MTSPIHPRVAKGHDSNLRLGAASGVLGVAVQLVAAALHPSRVPPNDSAAVFLEYAASNVWTAVHIAQFGGALLIALAFVALAVSLPRVGPTGALAVVGGAAALLAASVFAVQMAVDGVALKGAIDGWVTAQPAERAAAFLVADSVRDVEKGLSGFFNLLNGVTLLTLGLAVAASLRSASVLGWFGVVAGIGFMSGGVAAAHTGFSPEAAQILSPAVLSSAVFLAGICVSLWRRQPASDVVGPVARATSAGAAA